MKRSSNIWNWGEQIKTPFTKKLKLLNEKLEGKLSVLEGGGGKWKKEGQNKSLGNEDVENIELAQDRIERYAFSSLYERREIPLLHQLLLAFQGLLTTILETINVEEKSRSIWPYPC